MSSHPQTTHQESIRAHQAQQAAALDALRDRDALDLAPMLGLAPADHAWTYVPSSRSYKRAQPHARPSHVGRRTP